MALADELRTLLADTFAVYFRAHGHHWNVEGPDFREYHQLFEEIASDTYSSIDPLAENIRKLGEYAPFRIERLVESKTAPDKAKVAPDGRSLANDLLDANEYLIGRIKSAFDAADRADEQGIANFLAERIDMHQKWSWFLRSTVK